MDRNCEGVLVLRKITIVALRKESVDRNSTGPANLTARILSLSARRAWIEISGKFVLFAGLIVALRKESVDRNVFLTLTVRNVPIVALRKESVDRNLLSLSSLQRLLSRSPQGERG